MSQTITSLFNTLPFENRYKTYRILNYGKPYSNYKTYHIQNHSANKTNIFAIYVDTQTCNNIPTNKSLLSTSVPDENTALLQTKLNPKHFVEIHYTPETNKPKLEYIMTETDINDLLDKYDFGIKL